MTRAADQVIQIIQHIERHNGVTWIKKFVPIYLFHFLLFHLI